MKSASAVNAPHSRARIRSPPLGVRRQVYPDQTGELRIDKRLAQALGDIPAAVKAAQIVRLVIRRCRCARAAKNPRHTQAQFSKRRLCGKMTCCCATGASEAKRSI